MEPAVRPAHYWQVHFQPESGPWLVDLFGDVRDETAKDLRPGAIDAAKQVRWADELIADVQEALAHPYLTRSGPAWRLRLWRGGQAEWVRDVLQDEQGAILSDLADLRAAGRPETDPEIEQVRRENVWTVQLLREVGIALMHVVGPDEDPR